MPDDKVVVLGLVPSKVPEIEPADQLIARISFSEANLKFSADK